MTSVSELAENQVKISGADPLISTPTRFGRHASQRFSSVANARILGAPWS
jgi:hypothetical protein